MDTVFSFTVAKKLQISDKDLLVESHAIKRQVHIAQQGIYACTLGDGISD